MVASNDLVAALNAKLAGDALRVPPYPAVATRLQRMVQEERFGLQEVSNVVASDAALAALVLRHANTAGIGMATATATLGAAVFRLGVDAVIKLALASTIGATAGAPGPLAGLRRDCWRRSLLSALWCQELAHGRGVPSEQAFLAGLLHDFGAVVVVSTLEGMAGPRGLPSLPIAAWTELVDQFHVQVGAVVALKWQLPEPINSAMTHHHAPAGAPKPDRALVELVAAVDAAIAALDGAPSQGVAALDTVAALSNDERRRIAMVLPAIANHMASFEAALPPAGATVGKPTIPPELPFDLVPIDFPIEAKGTTTPYRASGLSDTTIAFIGKGALRPSWMTTVTLRCPRTPITIMVTIKTCTQTTSGYLVTAQPFGLAAADRAVWLDLLAKAVRDDEPATVCG